MIPADPGATETASGLAPIRVEGFSGPLDLLLHLARSGGIDLRGVSVVEVARQCDDYLRTLEAADLEAAGDHLVMAATLVHLKSRMLLPADPQEGIAAEGEGEEIPARLAGLVQELRKAAEQLQEREAAMELVYTRPAAVVAEFAGEEGIEADLYALVHAFQGILSRLSTADRESKRISRETMSLMDRVTWLIDLLQRERRVQFKSLFEGIADRLSCIVTFLALLEVLRLRVARAYASHEREDLVVILNEERADADSAEPDVPEPPAAAAPPEESHA
ncbi:MAG TPA: segregation/condensation protein A [Candidatus Polarisedimenticolia bacterium]|nr:segregation/condensation protein A [Candidatus Polarisedimenticolia bacterium]